MSIAEDEFINTLVVEQIQFEYKFLYFRLHQNCAYSIIFVEYIWEFVRISVE